MRARAALAALVFAPLVAVAQAPSPTAPEATRPEAEWSFGSGVSFEVFGFSGSTLGGLIIADVPVVTGSLERRLSGRTWLVLGGSGSVSRNRSDVPVDAVGFARDDARQFIVSGGVRRAITRVGAPVEVSGLILAEAGAVDAEQRFVSPGLERRQDMTSWLAGASVGIAVDRELTGGLSLRVASPLLGGRYTRSRVEEAGQPDRTGSGLSVRALLAPRLELRLAF